MCWWLFPCKACQPAAANETEEMDFLDMVDGEGNVLIQAQGLAFLAQGYWSVECHCSVKPAPSDCSGVFKR